MSDNEQMAFPSVIQYFPDDTSYHEKQGMSLRDYFAAAALQGLLANSFSDGISQPLSTANSSQMATMAFEQADAMLEARDK